MAALMEKGLAGKLAAMLEKETVVRKAGKKVEKKAA